MEKYDYNLSERLDHIAYMFNVRTARKAYENFIVNTIYARIGEPELMPVTQQYVYNPRDSRRYYLLDLYFPQLNYGVEIDERHHLDEDQAVRDNERSEDISAAIECEEGRIPIYSRDGRKRSIEEINGDIDREVMIIKGKIAAAGRLKWETNEDRKKEILTRGIFNVKDDVSYSSITEIYNICGGRRSGKNKGRAKMLQRCYYRLNDEYKLWVPILAIADEYGVVRNKKMGYENTLSDDKTVLTEKSDHPIDPRIDMDYKRVVFMRMKDIFGRGCIKFIGVFELTEESDDKEHVHIYRRISDEVYIKDLMP